MKREIERDDERERIKRNDVMTKKEIDEGKYQQSSKREEERRTKMREGEE